VTSLKSSAVGAATVQRVIAVVLLGETSMN
jgi:hypothetical protein